MAPLDVLIVEDDRNAREALAALLREEGHRVQVAGDGTEALARIQVSRPDLIITDINMPGMNGLELLRCLPCGVPAIAMTAFEDVGATAMDLGALACLSKPLELGELLAITDSLRSPAA